MMYASFEHIILQIFLYIPYIIENDTVLSIEFTKLYRSISTNKNIFEA